MVEVSGVVAGGDEWVALASRRFHWWVLGEVDVTSSFGVLVAQSCRWEELAEHAKAVEAAGFESVWVADQIANPFAETEWLEGWTALAGLALETERIRIGTLVTNIIYNHPGVIAK